MASRALERVGDNLHKVTQLRQWSFSPGFGTNAFVLLII